MKVLLCGGGNAVHVLASLIGSHPEYEVYIWSLHGDEAERLNNAIDGSGIKCHNDFGPDCVGKVNGVSKDPKDVVPEADMILLPVPAFTHHAYLKAMAPHITRPGVLIGALPAQGGFDIMVRDVFGKEKADRCVIFATETLPWACRIISYGHEVEVLGTKKNIDIAVTPQSQTTRVADLFHDMVGRLPVFEHGGSFLSVTLMNINSVWHPTIMHGKYRDWDGESEFPKQGLFYEEADEWTGDRLCAISLEVLELKKVLQEKYPQLDLLCVRHVREWMLRSYGSCIGDRSSTLARMLQTNKGYKGLTAPMVKVSRDDGSEGYLPDFKCRYMTEDIPFGLVVTRGVAELAGVATPTIDEVIIWAQEHKGVEYLVDGKLTGKDIPSTRCPQRYGFTNLDDFMAANHYLD